MISLSPFSFFHTRTSLWACRGAEQPAEEVVRLIHRTGGLAILAHPWSLKNPSPLIDRLKYAGLDGMEVYRSSGKDPGMALYLDYTLSLPLGTNIMTSFSFVLRLFSFEDMT